MTLSRPRRVTMAVTMACAPCGAAFRAAARSRFWDPAGRAAATRRRRAAARPVVVVPAGASRVPLTVYECDACGARAVGAQRCVDCHAFMRRVGLGGACPHCDEPITVAELVGLDRVVGL